MPEHQHPHTPRRQILGGLLSAAMLVPTVGASAPSFDCAKAQGMVESMICADAALGNLDASLADLYRQMIDRAGTKADPLRAAQREWLASRNQCQDTDCLAYSYQARIGQLRVWLDGPLGPIEEREGDGRIEIVQRGPLIELKARYPRLDGTDAAAATANRHLAAQVAEQLQAMRTDYLEFISNNDGEHHGPSWSLDIDYGRTFSNERLWTIDLTTYSFTGGAHGSFSHQALVFDRERGEPIPPAELFRADSDWLGRLSELSFARLSRREPFAAEPDDDWLRNGTAPEADNYQVLLPLADGLLVIFGQYQIGPYAIGIFDVLLGYDELADLLNPRWFGGVLMTLAEAFRR